MPSHRLLRGKQCYNIWIKEMWQNDGELLPLTRTYDSIKSTAPTGLRMRGILENCRCLERNWFSTLRWLVCVERVPSPFLTKHDYSKLGVQLYSNERKIAVANVCYPAGLPPGVRLISHSWLAAKDSRCARLSSAHCLHICTVLRTFNRMPLLILLRIFLFELLLERKLR